MHQNAVNEFKFLLRNHRLTGTFSILLNPIDYPFGTTYPLWYFAAM